MTPTIIGYQTVPLVGLKSDYTSTPKSILWMWVTILNCRAHISNFKLKTLEFFDLH